LNVAVALGDSGRTAITINLHQYAHLHAIALPVLPVDAPQFIEDE
jgi:hypothetical protein